MQATSALTETQSPEPRHFSTLGVIGAGLMGSGIAQVAAQAGLTVRLYDSQPGAVGRSRDQIAARLRRLVDGNRLAGEDLEAAMQRIEIAPDLATAASTDAIVEAIIEDVQVKQDLFRDLSDAALPTTLLATNTSAISITDIASASSRPENIVGMHFFSPVPAMSLCEIIRGYRTSDETLSAALQLAAALGKESIVVNRDDAGFVTSRLMTVLIHEAARILEDGLATPEDIDRACVLGFGHRMGPLATADLTGVDIAYRAGKAIFEGTGDPAFRPPELLRRMVSAGAYGRKTGEGFYRYGDEK